jgi:3-deoxy-D-manno-octulosonic-acid transferase
MALSIGRTLYNLTSKRDSVKSKSSLPRPDGDLIWLHAPTQVSHLRMLQLAVRLIENLGVTVLLTSPMPIAPQDHAGLALIQQPVPDDSASEAIVFLDHWRPNIILFSEGEIRPATLLEADDRRIPTLLVDARPPYLVKDREGWYPGLLRKSLQTLRHVMAIDDASVKALRKAGAISVDLTGRMEEPSFVLGHHEPERAALAQLMRSRPVWLAVCVPPAEEAAVIAAHRAALQQSHRLLLILIPNHPARAETLGQMIEESEGWMVALRGQVDEPEAEISVYIPEDTLELGLWYRLAPVCYLGGSLAAEGCIRNPMEAAALGSAILYGPRPGSFGITFGRLGGALAARAVGSADDLSQALCDLLAPERAAKMAHAAWGVASDGVEATGLVMDHVRRILDGEG